MHLFSAKVYHFDLGNIHILISSTVLYNYWPESEVIRGPGSIPTGGNNFHWIFLFSRSNASDANIGIIANFV